MSKKEKKEKKKPAPSKPISPCTHERSRRSQHVPLSVMNLNARHNIYFLMAYTGLIWNHSNCSDPGMGASPRIASRMGKKIKWASCGGEEKVRDKRTNSLSFETLLGIYSGTRLGKEQQCLKRAGLVRSGRGMLGPPRPHPPADAPAVGLSRPPPHTSRDWRVAGSRLRLLVNHAGIRAVWPLGGTEVTGSGSVRTATAASPVLMVAALVREL